MQSVTMQSRQETNVPVDEKKLYATTDASVWAAEFMAEFGDRKDDIDEGLMIGWFANAIETANTLSPFVGRLRMLTMAIDKALNELGVPTSDYPAPVANAVRILDDTRKNPGV